MSKKNSNFDFFKILFSIGFLFLIFHFIIKLVLGMNLYLSYLGWSLILTSAINYFVNEKFPFKKSWGYVKYIKKYIFISALVFLVFSIFGFLFPYFFQQQIINLISELAKNTENLGLGGMISYIFLNNLQSSFLAMAFGLFIGIFPFIVAVLNGYVLGFVASKSVDVEGITILWRLLPHGIFELPAIIISIGMGLRLGMFIFEKKKNTTKFYNLLLDSLRTFIFIIIPLLAIASIIEGSLIILLR